MDDRIQKLIQNHVKYLNQWTAPQNMWGTTKPWLGPRNQRYSDTEKSEAIAAHLKRTAAKIRKLAQDVEWWA